MDPERMEKGKIGDEPVVGAQTTEEVTGSEESESESKAEPSRRGLRGSRKVRKALRRSIGILWCVPDEARLPLYKEVIKKRKSVWWGANFQINPGQFEFPLTAYLYIKGVGVKYRGKIVEIDVQRKPHVTRNVRLVPKEFVKEKYPTFLKLVNIQTLKEPIPLNAFRKPTGEVVKSARNYIQVLCVKPSVVKELLKAEEAAKPPGVEVKEVKEELIPRRKIVRDIEIARPVEQRTIEPKIREELKRLRKSLPEEDIVHLGLRYGDTKLTSAKLKNILNWYYNINSALTKMKRNIPTVIKDKLIARLGDRRLSQDKLERILIEICNSYEQNLITPHESSGILAAQSIGEPGTQMTMRTFHYAGVAEMNVTLGLPRLIEILDARRTPSTPVMEIHLLDHLRHNPTAIRKLIAEIEITRIIDIADVIADMDNYEVIIRPDLKSMRRRGIKLDDLVKKLDKYSKIMGEISEERIVLKCMEPSYRLLQTLFETIKNFKIKGIDGIERVIARREAEGFVLYTEGSNLAKVLEVDGIDVTRTTTNDIMETYEVLGIEAARNAIIYEASKTLAEQGLTVDIRHIMLVADVMTVDGDVKAIGRHGISGKKTSILARAAFEITSTHLLNAGITGEVDELVGVAENIIVGQPVALGTGAVDLIYRPPSSPSSSKRASS